MGFTGHSGSTPPRSLRIILGGKLALACFFLGGIIVTHRYHRAATMSETPQEMLWETLAEQGLTDTSFITFTNVELSGLDEPNTLEELLQNFDPEADPEEIGLHLSEQFAAQDIVDFALEPVVVVPIGADPAQTRRLLIVDSHEKYLPEAKAQLDELGTLTGHVTRFSGDEFINCIFEAFGYDPPDELAEFGLDTVVYTIEPMEEPLDKSQAERNFWLCGLVLAGSLLFCCSGGPSAACCVFFFAPSLISLLGYPMRYGRGSTFVRMLYMAAGVGMIGYGYKLIVMDGQFGHVDGNPILHVLGFGCGFAGLAAFMSVPCQILTRKFIDSTEVQPRKKEKKMSLQEACSLTPLDTVARHYADGDLVVRAGDLCGEMQEIADSLAPLGFGEPIKLEWLKGDLATPTAIARGCENMVVADVELVGGQIITRLVSVLHDGLAVITVSKNSAVQADSRMGSNGHYSAGKSNAPIELMSLHLDDTASFAEKRDTTVVKIDDNEIRNVCELGRRVLTDIRVQYGEEDVEVGPKTYGRFKFPAQRVMGELASV